MILLMNYDPHKPEQPFTFQAKRISQNTQEIDKISASIKI